MNIYVRCNPLSDGSNTYDVICEDGKKIIELYNALSNDDAWDVRDALSSVIARAPASRRPKLEDCDG